MFAMANLLQILPTVFIAFVLSYILLHSKWGLLKGSSDSSEYVIKKKENYKKCTSEFKTYEELIETEKLEPGDLIECQRSMLPNIPVYDHWAVYVGQEKAIHFIPNGEIGTEIVREDLKKVVKESKCRINNLSQSGLDRGLVLRDGEVISQAAIDNLEKFKNGIMKDTYNLMDFNCEHFATLCAFGEPFSDQADNAKEKKYINVIGQSIGKTVGTSFEKENPNQEF